MMHQRHNHWFDLMQGTSSPSVNYKTSACQFSQISTIIIIIIIIIIISTIITIIMVLDGVTVILIISRVKCKLGH